MIWYPLRGPSASRDRAAARTGTERAPEAARAAPHELGRRTAPATSPRATPSASSSWATATAAPHFLMHLVLLHRLIGIRARQEDPRRPARCSPRRMTI